MAPTPFSLNYFNYYILFALAASLRLERPPGMGPTSFDLLWAPDKNASTPRA